MLSLWQGAFVPRRMIQDNAIVAQNVMGYGENKMKTRFNKSQNWYEERLWHNGIEIHFGNNEKI